MQPLISAAKRFYNGARRFAKLDEGVIMVEWVALAAGMVVAAVAISYILMHNTYSQARTVGSGVSGKVNTIFGPNASKL